jgi:hypothetical protein
MLTVGLSNFMLLGAVEFYFWPVESSLKLDWWIPINQKSEYNFLRKVHRPQSHKISQENLPSSLPTQKVKSHPSTCHKTNTNNNPVQITLKYSKKTKKLQKIPLHHQHKNLENICWCLSNATFHRVNRTSF